MNLLQKYVKPKFPFLYVLTSTTLKYEENYMF